MSITACPHNGYRESCTACERDALRALAVDLRAALYDEDSGCIWCDEPWDSHDSVCPVPALLTRCDELEVRAVKAIDDSEETLARHRVFELEDELADARRKLAERDAELEKIKKLVFDTVPICDCCGVDPMLTPEELRYKLLDWIEERERT